VVSHNFIDAGLSLTFYWAGTVTIAILFIILLTYIFLKVFSHKVQESTLGPRTIAATEKTIEEEELELAAVISAIATYQISKPSPKSMNIKELSQISKWRLVGILDLSRGE